jgi:ribosomal protein S27AE
MTSISSCPRCQAAVLIASLDTPSQRLRCPTCHEMFTLDEVLDKCIELPPQASLVESNPEPKPAEDRMTLAPTADEPLTLDHGEPVVPTHVEPPPMQEAASADPTPATVAPESAPEEDEYQIAGHAPAPVEEPQQPASLSGTSGAHQFETPRRRHRHRKPKPVEVGFLGNLVGIVLGGVIGLSLGYWILLWIGGREHDFLEIWDKLPSWSVPASP